MIRISCVVEILQFPKLGLKKHADNEYNGFNFALFDTHYTLFNIFINIYRAVMLTFKYFYGH